MLLAPDVQLLAKLASLGWWQDRLIGDFFTSAGSTLQPKAAPHSGTVIQDLDSVGFLLLLIPCAPQGSPLLQHRFPISFHCSRRAFAVGSLCACGSVPYSTDGQGILEVLAVLLWHSFFNGFLARGWGHAP